jgi:hypothetical protein
MATGSPNTVPPKNPAPKPPVPVEAVEAIEEEIEDAGPIVERITIGSLVVNKTVYDDGDMEMKEVKTEIRTVKAGPDEKFKAWRHAQPA